MPLSRSHTFSVWSRDAETTRLPSGVTATLKTKSEWPYSAPHSASPRPPAALRRLQQSACAVCADDADTRSAFSALLVHSYRRSQQTPTCHWASLVGDKEDQLV